MQEKEEIEEKLSAFISKCKESKLRLTPQRLEIFRQLTLAKDHPSAYMLHNRLQESMPTISLDTVYRTLLTFEQAGLIARVNTQESLTRFDAKTERHHHFICEGCREIVDVECRSFDELPVSEEILRWGDVKRINVVIYGICKKCQGKLASI
jgi:Fur family peroxide stress response transcriptional regulator